jgi:hypothetical protein
VHITNWETLVNRSGRGGCADYTDTAAYGKVEAEIRRAVAATVWPVGAREFTIFPQSGKKSGEGNGVKPIKRGFVETLAGLGWELEKRPPPVAGRDEGGKGSQVGAFDCLREFADGAPGPFVVEWETGNISSSHRAINRIALGILRGHISGGVLVVPSRDFARYLTDRVGNAPELYPYFDLWREWTLADAAYLGVVTVEYDATSLDVARIPKGTNGRALL